jgi:hypothetical protein
VQIAGDNAPTMGKQACEKLQHQRDRVAWLAARSGREANFTLDCAAPKGRSGPSAVQEMESSSN